MAVRLLVLFVAVAAVNAQPILVAQSNNQNFVPGVFISAETLKDLQEKAQKNQSPPIINQGAQPITNALSPNSQKDEPLKVGSSYQPNSSPQNQQPVLNQPAPAQPQVVVAQPVVTSQPSNPAVVVSQPNQAYLVSQPGNNQPVYLSQPANNQPTFISQPNQQVMLSNGQIATIVSNGQPSANGQTYLLNNGQPYVNNGQSFMNNGQPFVNNGQPFVSNGQSLLVSTNPGNNQITYLQSNPNTVQNPNAGMQYAVVPQNTNVPNNGNTYMVPSSNQIYAVSG